MEPEQALLIEQQLRQHVQLLTQNFLLTFQHPEFHEMSLTFKEYLVSFDWKLNINQFYKSIINLSNVLKYMLVVI